MATISGYQGNWAVDLIVVEDNLDAISNTSSAPWELWIRRIDSGTYPMYGTPTINIWISGKLAHSSSIYRRYDSIGPSGVKVESGTLTSIEHNDDGTIKSNAASFTWTGSGFSPNNISASGTYETSVIQRRSIVTGTRAYIGEVSNIQVTRYVNTFTHSISYSFGTQTGYIRPDGTTSQTEYIFSSTDGINFPIPTTWYSEIPNSPNGDCTLSIKTYNGSTQVGSTYSSTFKVVVDETISNPQIVANVSDDLNTTIKAITGFSSSNIVLVKGYSTPEITWSITPRNSATITSKTINDVAITTSPSSFTLTTNTIIVRAIDSRGFSKDYSVPFTLVDYFVPTFELQGSRVDDTSLYVDILFNGRWFKDTIGNTQNSISRIYWKYIETGSDPSLPWTFGGNLIAGEDYVVNNDGTFYSGDSTEPVAIEIGPLPDYTKTYTIGVIIEDAITANTTNSQSAITIPGGIPLINWEEDFVNINGDIRQYNNSIISESGTIKLTLSANQTINPNITTKVNMDTIAYNTSSKLTLSNGAVYIGDGVTSVLVNCRFTAWGPDINNRYIYVYKNGYLEAFNSSPYSSTIETTVVVPVQENDYIEMYCYNEQNSSINITSSVNQTFLQVTILK